MHLEQNPGGVLADRWVRSANKKAQDRLALGW